MFDMTGKGVKEGDFMIDDRGKLLIIQPTPPTYLKEKLLTVTEYKAKGEGKRGFMRQKLALKVSEGHLRTPQKELREMWSWNYAKYQQPQGREEIRKRRKEFQERRKRLS